ncbi:hypothetical protein ACQ4PT_006214 [Festuca glaucescens]
MAVAAPGQLNLEEYPSWGSRGVDCFEKLEQIGEGTYGQVFMAKDTETKEIVALKKIRMDNEREGFPITAIREIKILKKLHHQNVIHLKEIVTSPGPERDEQGKQVDGNKYKGSIYMVFEYMDHDLTGLADKPGMRFTIPQIKCYMKQLLTGLHYCHVNQVLHRDIKGSNLLIDNEGNLKLADFGLARSFSSDHNGNLTNRVITLWYRPPELLLGSTKYGPAVDMWSVGCIFAELLNGKPILPGKNEPDQLTKIFELCGTPDEIIWPGVTKMPWYNNLKPPRQVKRHVKDAFKQGYLQKKHLMLNIFGLIPYHVIPKACQSTRHHMNTRRRKDVNSSGKLMMLLQSGKKRSILSLMPVCPQSSNQANCILKSGQASLRTIHIHQWHLGQIITMESLEGQEGLTGTHRVGTKVAEGIRTVEGKVVAMAVARTLNKVEGRLHTLVVRWAGQVVQGVAAATVAMVQVRQIFRKPVLMVLLVAQAGGQIIPHKLVLETSSSRMEETGNSMYYLINSMSCRFILP